MVATSEVWRFLLEIRFPVPFLQNRSHVQALHLKARPFGLPKEFEARFLRRIALEAVDADHFAQLEKTVFLDEEIHNHGERDAVEDFVVSVVLGILHIENGMGRSAGFADTRPNIRERRPKTKPSIRERSKQRISSRLKPTRVLFA